jgi:hypothetical protein
LITHVDYINYWHARRAHIFEEQHPIIDIDVYVDWYMHITCCFITLIWDYIPRCPCVQYKLHTPIYNKLVCISFFCQYNLSVFHIYIYIYILVYIRWCFFIWEGHQVTNAVHDEIDDVVHVIINNYEQLMMHTKGLYTCSTSIKYHDIINLYALPFFFFLMY